MKTWHPPTYADDVGIAPATHVLCKCGRTTRAELLVLLHDITEEHRAHAGWQPGQQYGCDGCRERLVLSGAMTQEGVAVAMRAPAAIRAKMKKSDEQFTVLRRSFQSVTLDAEGDKTNNPRT